MQCILCAHEASHPALKPTDCILMLMSHHTAHDMLSICHVYIYIYIKHSPPVSHIQNGI